MVSGTTSTYISRTVVTMVSGTIISRTVVTMVVFSQYLRNVDIPAVKYSKVRYPAMYV